MFDFWIFGRKGWPRLGSRTSGQSWNAPLKLPKFNRGLASAVACSGLGAAAFYFVGFPLPMLLGPMVGCLVASLAGVRLAGAGNLGVFMRTFLGVAFGASVTPELLDRVPEIALSLAFVPLFAIAMVSVGYAFFRKIVGFDAMTSYYSSMPGGMQEIILYSEEEGVNIRAISLVHATRLMAVFAFVPVVATHYFGLDLDRPPGLPAASMPWHEIAIMVASGFCGWRLAAAFRVPGSSIIGPMILTAILSLSGIINSRPPLELMLIAQFFIGMAIGVRYAGITPNELRMDVLAGLGYCVLSLTVCLALIFTIRNFLSADLLDMLLAFLPGGQAEMAVIALIAGTDVAYVVLHQLARVLIVITVGKWVAEFIWQRK